MEEKERNCRTHPREKDNLFSQWLFWSELPFVYKGYKKPITESDLYDPRKCHKSNTLADKLENTWNKESQESTNLALWKALLKVFGFEFLMYGILLIPLELVIQMCQPFLIGRLMDYFAPNQTYITKTEAYIDSSVLVIASFLYVVIGHSIHVGLDHLGMKVRIALGSLLYRKSLKLNHKALSVTGSGQILNLLANDIARFEYSLSQLHYLWMAPIETLIIFGVVYWVLGPTAVIGIGLLLFFIPVQIYLAKKVSTYRMKTAIKTDQRVNLMGEILAGIKVIKMFTWEKPFTLLLEQARKMEMMQIQKKIYVESVNRASPLFLARTAIFFCILVYVLIGGSLNPQYVYVLSSFYEIIRLSAVLFLPFAMMMFGETVTSVKRLTDFLTQPETICDQNFDNTGIKMKHIETKWDLTSNNVLSNINLEVRSGKFVSIIGPVGSGKSTLLQVILKELNVIQGTLEVGGTISYASQQPWLFSGTIRENILFGEDFDRIKYEKVIRVCALEHDFSQFSFGDLSLVGERGIMLSGGQKARISLARAVYREADIYLLDDPLSAVDANVGKQLFENCFKNYLGNKTRILVTHQLQFLRDTDFIYLLENGTISQSGTYKELIEKNHDFLNLLENQKSDRVDEILEEKLSASSTKQEEIEEGQEKGVVSKKVYIDFFKFGGIWAGLLAILMQAIMHLFGVGGDYFLSFWVNLEETNNQFLDTYDCLYIYTAFILLLIISSLLASVVFFRYCIQTSIQLHKKMFNTIVYSPLRFFHVNSSGRILNRFSKDMGLIDENLPESMMDVIEIAFNIIGIIIVITIINPWILIPTVVMFLMFYYIRKIFMASTRDLKRIEAKTRSPMYSQVSASLEGLTTIRAFRAQNHLQTQFDKYQDLHSSVYYMFLVCDGAFGFWLDVICVIFLAIVTFSFLFLNYESYSANVGLSITQSIMMTGLLQWAMKQSADLENQMTSVERVLEYTNLQSEPNSGTKKLPIDWPSHGKIIFDNVSLRYSLQDTNILKNISFVINPKEKIGIVGRTGAGKSSLVSVFFRLAYLEGDVLIDGININNVSLENLRSKITIIPQDPTLFSGSIRYNLDPFMDYRDSDLWEALQEVELKSVVSDLPGGLSSKVTENGNNFSVGQIQLFCLARAILRKNKILILDEATANVDLLTDELIQKTIRRKFQDCTVLTIAHRINTVLNSDKILVLEDGNIVEFDEPLKLLENSNGTFYRLVNQRDE